MNVIIKDGTGQVEEKKSVFIANIKAVQNEEEAISYVAFMKKKYWDAKHNCMAYIVGDAKRFSDDGEPQGTAGKPMLDVLEARNITNVVVVVTRYFGGVLLGTGGLVRAYQGAVIEGLKNCEIAKKCQGISAIIKTDYTGLGKIRYAAGTNEVNIADIEYLDYVMIKIVCEEEKYSSFINKITEMTAGKADISEIEKVFFYKSDHGIQLL
ncbi:MAG: YigZ family protein [Lachnospiraceae bacterium]|nr:YigZ family protein [Lachnospiraceae bacterium]